MADDGQELTPFAYHGQRGEMIRLALVNFLWSVATLSVFRFWGRTRIRRMLWGGTTALGDPVEYTGTGKELFLGFLIVMVTVYLPIVGAFTWAEMLIKDQDPLGPTIVSALYVLVGFLASAGLYRARRYQLSRTCWRGIRGGQGGHAWRFGLMGLAVAVAVPVTLGWALPWGEMWLARYKLRHTRFGDHGFDCDATAAPSYRAFTMLWFVGVPGMVGAGFLAWGLSEIFQKAGLESRSYVAMVLVYVIWVVMLTFEYAAYKAALYQAQAAGTRFQGVSFTAKIDKWPLVRLFLGNLLISLFSLGILRPWAAQRTFRFTCKAIRASGTPDFAAIHQNADTGPRTGEGLASAFDGVGEF